VVERGKGDPAFNAGLMLFTTHLALKTLSVGFGGVIIPAL
jgi:hypothetical protein